MMLRITLLVLVTGLFALTWTQDQPRPNPSRRESQELAKNVPVKADCPTTQTSLTESAASSVDSGLPLPAGIVPGEYRAVSSTGIVRQLRLTREDVRSQAEFATRAVYESAGENIRWYFIRVQSNPEDIFPTVAERTRAVRPTAAESSELSFEQEAGRIILKAGRLAADRLRQFVEDPQTAGGVLEMLRSWKRLSSGEPENSRL